MFGRPSLRELFTEMRDESQERSLETKVLFAEMREEAKRRDAESKRRDEEIREFNREILLRNEKVYTAMIAQLEENTEQTRANTQAVLSLLDRFNGSDGLAV
jgi:hypothetical protein